MLTPAPARQSTARRSRSAEGSPVPRTDRPRYQVVIQLMPGAEPWMRVETDRGPVKLPAACSLLELWETVQRGPRGAKAPTGEVMVRVPLDLVLASPTIGELRRQRAR